MSHWPGLSERERLWLLSALGLNGVLSMSVEVAFLVALVRAGRRSWRARDRGVAAAGRAAGFGAAGWWLVLSLGQKATARLAFTSYERFLSRRHVICSQSLPGHTAGPST